MIPHYIFEPPLSCWKLLKGFFNTQNFLFLFHPKKPAIVPMKPLNSLVFSSVSESWPGAGDQAHHFVVVTVVLGLCHLLSLLKILHFDILLQYSTLYDTFAGRPKATFLPYILHAIFILLSSMHYRNQSFFLLFPSSLFLCLSLFLFFSLPLSFPPPPKMWVVTSILFSWETFEVMTWNFLEKIPKKPQMETICNILGTLMA